MFNAKDYLNKMLVDKQKHIQILAVYALTKKFTFEDVNQLKWFVGRNVRAAKRLECFTIEKIKQTLEWLLETADYKVTLETVEKFIMESPKKVSGEKPILVLSNGDEIYDTTSLSRLESEGRIRYDKRTKRWAENI